jgi:hypothetical protein
LCDSVGTAALFSEGLAVVKIVEKFSGIGHGQRR